MFSTIMLVILCGLIAAVSWGFSDFLSAKASKSVGPIASASLVAIIGAFIFLLAYVLFLRPELTLTVGGVIFAACSGATLAAGLLAFFKGLDAGPVSLVSPISGAYPLVTTILALFAFNARLSFGQIIGIGGIVMGVLLAAELISFKRPIHKIGTGPAWALLTVLGWGIGFGLLAQAITQLGWETATLIELTFTAISFMVLLPFVKDRQTVSTKKLIQLAFNKYIMSASIILLIGDFALNIGLSFETVSGGAITVAISACYPVLTIFLALRHFKENIKVIPLAGAFISIAGVVVLSIS